MFIEGKLHKDSEVRIVVHNGMFHADDVFSVALLKWFYAGRTIIVTRTREVKAFDQADFVIDTGFIHDGMKYFDHHQPMEPRANGVPYASFGLLVQALFSGTELFETMDEFAQSIDSQDNGGYNPTKINLNGWVKMFNPAYGAEEDDTEQFTKAVEIAYTLLSRYIEVAEGKAKAKKEIEAVSSVDENILVLSKSMPWQEWFFETGHSEDCIVFPGKEEGQWVARAVPVEGGSMVNKVTIPEEVSELPGFVFRHKSGFMAVFSVQESAILAAKSAK